MTDTTNPDARVQSVLTKARALCNPTNTEVKKISAVAEEAKNLVERQKDKKTSEIKEIIFGGSFAKGTWLRGDADIDIFMKIEPSVNEKEFEKLGVEIGKNALKKYRPKLRYSDHPYVEATIRGVRINIVPCYDVQKGKWKSAADRSPFHTQYILESLDSVKKEHVRLLKKFLKSAGIYGAEISIGGFSGYVSEVLIAKYGTLEGVLAAATEFKYGQVISVDSYDLDVARSFSSPLVIIDPVDPRRNLGTAISPESVGRFVLAARAFLRNPSGKFLVNQERKINTKLYGNVLVVEFSHRERSPDTIWGQVRRSANSIAKQLELADFTVFRTTCKTDERKRGVFAFLLESAVLPTYTIRKGPEIARAQDTESFIKASRELAMWADREIRVSAIVERKAKNADKLVKTLLSKTRDSSGIAKDMITSKVKVYSVNGTRKISGLVKEAVDELVSTENLIFFK